MGVDIICTYGHGCYPIWHFWTTFFSLIPAAWLTGRWLADLPKRARAPTAAGLLLGGATLATGAALLLLLLVLPEPIWLIPFEIKGLIILYGLGFGLVGVVGYRRRLKQASEDLALGAALERERCLTNDRTRQAEILRHVKVIAAGYRDSLDATPELSPPGGKLVALPLELGRLDGARGDHDRDSSGRRESEGAQPLCAFDADADGIVDVRTDQRLEIVNAGEEHRGRDGMWLSENHRGEMPAGRAT